MLHCLNKVVAYHALVNGCEGDRQSREHRCGSQLQYFTVNHTISDLCLFLWIKKQLKNSFSRILGFTSSSQTCSMPHSECSETNKLKQMDSGRGFDHHCFTLICVSVKIQVRALAQSGIQSNAFVFQRFHFQWFESISSFRTIIPPETVVLNGAHPHPNLPPILE